VLILLQGNPNIPLIFAILAGCAVGTVIGFINGVIVTKFRVPAFIVTLAVGIMARSIALYLVEGRALTGDSTDHVFRAIGTGSIGFLPIPLLIWIFLTVLLGCALKYTKFGTYVYAVGGNEVSSKYSGIAVDRTKIIAYSLTGLCAGMAAILDISRTVTLAVPTAGHMYEFDAITAVVVGGAALSGGRGKVLNTFFGAIIITVVSNLMAMLGISVFLSGFVKGTVILVAVLLQRRERTA
jgi:ribose transport system permease protein